MMTVEKCLAVMVAVIISFSVGAQTKPRTVKEVVYAFRDAVNAHDTARMAAFVGRDHVSVGVPSGEVSGKDNVMAGWMSYFKQYPDYTIDITDVFAHGDTVALFGFVAGSYNGVATNHWRVPVSWKVVVAEHKIKLWQVYMDMKAAVDMAAKGGSVKGVDTTTGVTGVGGVFFKCKDRKVLMSWYKEHLHVNTNPYGAKFDWRRGDDATKYGCTQWTPFSEKTTYFAPSAKEFMINYRVRNLVQLVAQLRRDGVTILDNIEDSDYGKFVHILDCEQNKVELWEPKEEDYDKQVGGQGK